MTSLVHQNRNRATGIRIFHDAGSDFPGRVVQFRKRHLTVISDDRYFITHDSGCILQIFQYVFHTLHSLHGSFSVMNRKIGQRKAPTAPLPFPQAIFSPNEKWDFFSLSHHVLRLSYFPISVKETMVFLPILKKGTSVFYTDCTYFHTIFLTSYLVSPYSFASASNAGNALSICSVCTQ